jgi:hypothetical protein
MYYKILKYVNTISESDEDKNEIRDFLIGMFLGVICLIPFLLFASIV